MTTATPSLSPPPGPPPTHNTPHVRARAVGSLCGQRGGGEREKMGRGERAVGHGRGGRANARGDSFCPCSYFPLIFLPLVLPAVMLAGKSSVELARLFVQNTRADESKPGQYLHCLAQLTYAKKLFSEGHLPATVLRMVSSGYGMSVLEGQDELIGMSYMLHSGESQRRQHLERGLGHARFPFSPPFYRYAVPAASANCTFVLLPKYPRCGKFKPSPTNLFPPPGGTSEP